ncbi:MAG: hypothetical protein QXT68_07475 [Halobacteria archaeon]
MALLLFASPWDRTIGRFMKKSLAEFFVLFGFGLGIGIALLAVAYVASNILLGLAGGVLVVLYFILLPSGLRVDSPTQKKMKE